MAPATLRTCEIYHNECLRKIDVDRVFNLIMGRMKMNVQSGVVLRAVISRIRVPVGFVMAILYFYVCQPTPLSLIGGCSIALLGIILRAWASGHLYKNQRVATSGAYAFTRNPLYLGSFIIGLGFCLVTRSYSITAVFVILFAAFYFP